MSNEPIRIKRYPNRRFYASHTSRYISLPEIEQLIRDGATVEIIDSQTAEDITRTVLMQIIAERHPDKMAMFPAPMLHSMLRANKLMTGFLQEYFRNALAYLDTLQKHGATGSLPEPMHWMKPWFDQWPKPHDAKGAPKHKTEAASTEDADIGERIARLEEKIAQLESKRGRKR